jgi:hypothetical protein
MSNITNTCIYQACTKPPTCTIPRTNHVPQSVSQQMHQPCTNTCTKSCINHAPQPVPNCASTMDLNMYQTMHQPCTSTYTICLNHKPCLSSFNHVPYHVSTMYINIYTTSSASTMHQTSTNMPISPRCAPSTIPTSSVQHTPQSCANTRTKLCFNKYYTNINKTCIQ